MSGKLLRQGALALAALAGMALNNAQAAAVHFDVVGTGFALAQGNTYGTDANNNPNRLLGVTFSATAPNLHQIENLAVGQSYSFQFGTVALHEEGNNGSNVNNGAATITEAERTQLGVSALFKFLEPVNSPDLSISAVVTAVLGNLVDAAVDFSIDWADTTVSFGNGGQFSLSLDDLNFNRNHMSIDQWATITLISAPVVASPPNNGGSGGNAVPEPGSLALAGLGLGIAGFIGRRRKQQQG